MMIHTATMLLSDLEILKAQVKTTLKFNNGRLNQDQIAELCRIKRGLNEIVETLIEETEAFRKRYENE